MLGSCIVILTRNGYQRELEINKILLNAEYYYLAIAAVVLLLIINIIKLFFFFLQPSHAINSTIYYNCTHRRNRTRFAETFFVIKKKQQKSYTITKIKRSITRNNKKASIYSLLM